MSWDMWHVTGTGFDLGSVDPQKYRDFILNHRQSLESVMDTDTVQNLIHYLTERPNELEVNTNPEVFDQIFDLITDDDDYYPASEEELLSIAKDYGLNPRSYEELEAMIFNDESGDLTCWTVHAYTNEEDEPWYLIRRKEEEKS